MLNPHLSNFYLKLSRSMEENFTKRNNIPFKAEMVKSNILCEHENKDNVLELDGNSDKIVRKESFKKLEQLSINKVDPVELAVIGKKLFKELEDYNILAPVEFIIGQDEQGEKVVYEIVHKIKGGNLEEVEITKETQEEVEKLYNSIANYYLCKSRKEENFLADINSASQYVYGTTKENEQKRIYLTDTDLYINSGKVALLHVVKWFLRHMTWVEEKFDKNFEIARNNIKEIIENIVLPENLTEEEKNKAETEIKEINDILVGNFKELNMDEKGFIVGRIL